MSYSRRFSDHVLPANHQPTSRRAPYVYDYNGEEPVRQIVPAMSNACEKHGLDPCPDCLNKEATK